jgi:undecaprenyl-diphosphatase
MGIKGQAHLHVFHAVSARVDHLDRRIIEIVAGHRRGWATDVANETMYLGTTPRVLLMALLALLVAVVALRAYRAAVVAGLALLLALLAAEALKKVFERARPPGDLALASANTYSFPSTQAAQTSAIAASLIVLLLVGPGWGPVLSTNLSRRTKLVLSAALVAAVAFVGLCIVYLGAHWFTDVLAGWLLGTTIGVTVGLVGGRIAAPSTARSPARATIAPSCNPPTPVRLPPSGSRSPD